MSTSATTAPSCPRCGNNGAVALFRLPPAERGIIPPAVYQNWRKSTPPHDPYSGSYRSVWLFGDIGGAIWFGLMSLPALIAPVGLISSYVSVPNANPLMLCLIIPCLAWAGFFGWMAYKSATRHKRLLAYHKEVQAIWQNMAYCHQCSIVFSHYNNKQVAGPAGMLYPLIYGQGY
jgi:hypothetical protein